MENRAQPPETLEGWYALHQVFHVNHAALRALESVARREAIASARQVMDELAAPNDRAGRSAGWSIAVDLVGSRGDLMLVHLRPTLETLAEAQYSLARSPIYDALELVYSFLSVTEAGLYALTAQLAKRAAARGGKVGDETYAEELAVRTKAELESPHVTKRLYPDLPAELPYVCFYPMDKRRAPQQNWYAEPVEERSRMMQEHGLTGRRYAGRVVQIVTGAIGFDAWEWGVTLFAKDPLDFKKLVTDMRFDEVSAQYADFGEFFVGKRVEPGEWLARLV